jgi:hypothetical protein
VAGITLFALVVIAGLIGNQSPFKNIAPTSFAIGSDTARSARGAKEQHASLR